MGSRCHACGCEPAHPLHESSFICVGVCSVAARDLKTIISDTPDRSLSLCASWLFGDHVRCCCFVLAMLSAFTRLSAHLPAPAVAHAAHGGIWSRERQALAGTWQQGTAGRLFAGLHCGHGEQERLHTHTSLRPAPKTRLVRALPLLTQNTRVLRWLRVARQSYTFVCLECHHR